VKARTRDQHLSPGEKAGIVALAAALPLYAIQPVLATIPLAAFLLLCLGAPFIPSSTFFLPVVSRAGSETDGIALTLDDGPSPASPPLLLDLLARHNLQATFFVTGTKAAKYPELITAILAGGHTIGNHSLRHDSFLMLRSPKTLQADIRQAQEIMKKSGITPLVFRPPIGISGPRLPGVLSRENLVAVTYSCRAYDRGNRTIRNLAGKILRRLHPGDIIMLHDLPPRQDSLTGQWRKELELLFSALRTEHRVVPLEVLIGRPVMQRDAEAQPSSGWTESSD